MRYFCYRIGVLLRQARKQRLFIRGGKSGHRLTLTARQHHPFHYSMGDDHPTTTPPPSKTAKTRGAFRLPPTASSRAEVRRAERVHDHPRTRGVRHGRSSTRSRPAGRKGAVGWSEASKMAATEARGILMWCCLPGSWEDQTARRRFTPEKIGFFLFVCWTVKAGFLR